MALYYREKGYMYSDNFATIIINNFIMFSLLLSDQAWNEESIHHRERCRNTRSKDPQIGS